MVTVMDGLHVLDVTRVIPGPHCAMLPGDDGAVAVEKRGLDEGSGHCPEPF